MDRFLRFYIIGVFSITFLAYYLCIYFYKKSGISVFKSGNLSLYFWASTIIIFLILCNSSALLSHDLFEYSVRGRMLSIYKLNPYLHVPMEIKNDIFFPLIFWKSTPECYGPLWVAIGAVHTLFFKNNVALTSFMHKLVLLAFLGMTPSVFYKLCKDNIPEDAGATTLALLLNPLVIVMTLIDGHNEIVMVFFILCAFYFLLKSKHVLSYAFLALAIAVKFVYVLFIPVFILYAKKTHSVRERVYGVIIGGAIFIFTTVVAWLPFGRESVKAIIYYYTELSKNFWVDSIPSAIYFISDKAGIAISKNLLANVFLTLFAIAYFCILGYLVRNAQKNRGSLFTAAALILLALLFTNSTPFQAWYLLWVIPFIFLSNIRLKFQLVFLLSYFLIMTFWKRMCVLAVPMLIVYSFILLRCKNTAKETGYKNT
ncbi:MAG: glycosyltransferase family 87 protein [Candidatus Omnitrophota bacterium]|nr:glycosyltransferase family 87 protein [Candidatus Omnitrophota bacterium]